MDDIIKKKKIIKNIEGKKLLEKTKLDYSIEIIKYLKSDYKIIESLLDELEITEEDFFNNLSTNTNANISFYDQTLKILIKKKKLNIVKKEE